MTTSIYSCKDGGPYFSDAEHSYAAPSLEEFIARIRACFDNQDDAILVKHGDEVVGLWLREPDIDCDSDGFYEVHSENDYCLYRPTYKGFWNYVGYHFGHNFVPEQHGFQAQRHPKL